MREERKGEREKKKDSQMHKNIIIIIKYNQ